MVVHLMGALTRTVKPGDAVTLSGIFLPEPFTVRLGCAPAPYQGAVHSIMLTVDDMCPA